MQELSHRIPLVVGVTGHRDPRPEDIPALEKEFEAILRRLRDVYQGTVGGDAPIVLVSALAEGADRLAARVASAAGATLVVALPMPAEEYRRDFETAAAQTEFDQLMERAATIRVMGFTPGNTPANVRDDPVCRAKQYRAVGIFIVQQCNVLVALWDGNDGDRAMGGTAEVVAFKREGIPLGISRTAGSSLDGSEIGPVIHLVTPRVKSGASEARVSTVPWGADITGKPSHGKSSRDVDVWETFGELSALTREFNADAAEIERMNVAMSAEDSISNLFSVSAGRPEDEAARQYAANEGLIWCRFFGIADSLAKKRQAQFRSDWIWLFLLSLAGFFMFAFADHFGFANERQRASMYLLALYLAAGAIGSWLLVRIRNRRDQERFLDYRAFAEALRVAVYWNILGLFRSESGSDIVDQREDAINSVADLYPIKQPSELTWVKDALRTLDLCRRSPSKTRSALNDATAYKIVRQYWVMGQERYFTEQRERHDQRANELETWSLVCFFVTPVFVVAMLLSIGGVLPLESQIPIFDGNMRFRDLLLVASGLLPGIAAALTGYSERLAFAAQANQYERMRLLFKRAHDLLPEQFPEDARTAIWAVFRELGIEAMKESADWVSIYRQRPIKSLQ